MRKELSDEGRFTDFRVVPCDRLCSTWCGKTGEAVKIAIIGTGRMGRGFATALAPKHEVTVGSRDPNRARQTASKTAAARGTTYAEAAADAEVVILTVPGRRWTTRCASSGSWTRRWS